VFSFYFFKKNYKNFQRFKHGYYTQLKKIKIIRKTPLN